MRKFTVVYTERHEVEVESTDIKFVMSQLQDRGITKHNGRMVVSILEVPPPFPKDHQCPECWDKWYPGTLKNESIGNPTPAPAS